MATTELVVRERVSLRERLMAVAPEAAMLMACFGACAARLASADTWWHLATGRWIAQHRAVPHVDPFSYSFGGKPWIAHEYLADLGMYCIHRLGGFAGLTLVNTALLTLAFWFLFRSAKGSAWVRAGVVVLGAWAARPGFALRPHTFTLLLGAVFLWIAHEYLRDGRVARLVWLPILTVCWVQLHGGYILGIALLLAVAGAEALDCAVGRGDVAPGRIWRLVAAALACVCVVPLNPNGVAMLRYPFAVLSMKANQYIVEWQAPQLQYSRFWSFLALAALTLAAMLFSRKAYRPGQLLLFAATLGMALRSGRNIPIFVLIAVPLLAEHVRTEWAGRLTGKASAGLRAALASGVVAMCVIGCVMQTKAAIEFQRAAESTVFPKAAVDYLVEHHLRPNLLNDYAYGGYLIWRLYPEYKVLIDGRADMYGDPFVLAYFDVYMGFENPEPLLTNAGINTVLVSPASGLAGVFRIKTGNDSWRVSYEDEKAVIFVRTAKP